MLQLLQKHKFQINLHKNKLNKQSAQTTAASNTITLPQCNAQLGHPGSPGR